MCILLHKSFLDLSQNPSYMPTTAFVQAKKVGRWFEPLTRTALAEKGFELLTLRS
jgi:hypothetical protein